MPRSFLVKKHLSNKKPNYGELDSKKKVDAASPHLSEEARSPLPCPVICSLRPLKDCASGAVMAESPASPPEHMALPAPKPPHYPHVSLAPELAFPHKLALAPLGDSLPVMNLLQHPDTRVFQPPVESGFPMEQGGIPTSLLGLVPGVQEHFECLGCRKAYFTVSGLARHRQLHCEWHCPQGFSCKYCNKEYVSLGALKMHIRTHTLPCVCKLCGKAFSRPWLLQGHIRTHTGEKPFSCPHCSRAFADRSNLRAHLQTHSDIKKYQCKNCSKTFSRISLLSKHEEAGCCPLS
ncbi:zinc finger protein SNAI3 [Brienomyrus brachyistius]|uniref:zinc finger protein SNAI3 n=1 Tax=Brienomyrus brachyistius TaxID=42636 RepID=UPI0020B2948D|nr:zinc finger protein SNAI3 [Brienomyrus brachyistius]